MTEHIVIVGGGAGGLELATQLGRKLGRRHRARITLIDRNRTHLWKPLLHEVAAGSLDSDLDELDYRGHAARHHFDFVLGEFQALDRDKQELLLAPLTDDAGETVLEQRRLHYDRLVLAIGGQTHDFGTPGAAQHCYFLDSVKQAERFRSKLINEFLKSNQQIEDRVGTLLRIAIVGAGATGVELAAELVNSVKLLSVYGLGNITRSHLQITLIEAGPRILGALPEHLALSAAQQLQELGVTIRTQTSVVSVTHECLQLSNDESLAAEILVWAAGIKAPDFLATLGLSTGRGNQIQVDSLLRSVDDPQIYAIGDCAASTLDDGTLAPPRAQTAHQMASCVYSNLIREFQGKEPRNFQYKDHGSLVSLSRFSAVGKLMGGRSLSLTFEGRLARWAYASLYWMHQRALHGWWRMALIVIINKLSHALRPRLKLH